MSYLTLGLSVGATVTLMMYFKIIHPPAAANPLIALFADVSLSYIVFPVIVGSIFIHCFICNNKSIISEKEITQLDGFSLVEKIEQLRINA
jgi:CBS-domain-containing membrane protein